MRADAAAFAAALAKLPPEERQRAETDLACFGTCCLRTLPDGTVERVDLWDVSIPPAPRQVQP